MIIDEVRSKLNMEDSKEVAIWEMADEIHKTPVNVLVQDFVLEMMNEFKGLEKQIEELERQRLSNLNDKVFRKQCRQTLDTLRKERDGLRETLGNKTYKRMVTELSRRDLYSR
jgi:hypothetical protein